MLTVHCKLEVHLLEQNVRSIVSIQVTSTREKLEDISLHLLSHLLESCIECGDTIDQPVFVCHRDSPKHITYRARLEGTSERDSGSLVSLIMKWVSKGETIIVSGILMKVDTECLVAIKSLHEGECSLAPTSQVASSSTQLPTSGSRTTASTIVVGVLVPSILITLTVSITVVTICVLKRNRQNGL